MVVCWQLAAALIAMHHLLDELLSRTL